MTEHRPEHIELCAAWALGALDDADWRRFEEHVAGGCPECEAATADFSAATVMLAASAPPATPDPALRARVLAAVANSVERGDAQRMASVPPPAPRVIEMRPRPSRFAWVPLAAAAALTLASGLLWMRVSRLDHDLAASRGQISRLDKEAADARAWSSVLGSPAARVSVLEPTTDGDPRLRARATYDPTSRRAVVVVENFYPPQGHDYQLWVIKDGAPASLGIVHSDAEGHATLQLDNVGDSLALSAFAISLEPPGGSPNPAAPSGPVIMLGKLSS